MKQFTISAAFVLIALSGFSMAHTLEKRSLWGGAPAETPEVAHAKALHFAAHAAARGHGHPQQVYHGYHVPVIHNGVPVDTPEVQHAKAAHYAAVAKATAETHSHGPWDDGSDHYSNDHYGNDHYAHAHHAQAPHHGPIHIPVIHNGVPTETPEVQHAKAAHYAAVHEAQSRSGGYDGHDDGSYHHGHGHHAQW